MTEARSSGNGVNIAMLLDPPTRELMDPGIGYVLDFLADANPGNDDPDWELKVLAEDRDMVLYVPPNSCARARFRSLGYLGTAHLNGCVAAAAAYRDERDGVETFLGHYTAEAVRDVGTDGRLKLSTLLANFTGSHPVRAAIAFPAALAPTQVREYDPADAPVDALVAECRKLPAGSSVLLIPYENSRDLTSPTLGHMLYTGRGGADLLDFGWNGHQITVGEPEPFDDSRRATARALAEAMLESEPDWQ